MPTESRSDSNWFCLVTKHLEFQMPKIFPRRRTQLAQSQALQTLAPHHRAMARLAAMGMRQGDLAQRFTLSGAQVSKILASPLFQSEMLRISEGMEMEAGEAE